MKITPLACFIIALTIISSSLLGQEVECSTPNLTPEEFAAYKASIQQHISSSADNKKTDIIYDIPVYLYRIDSTDGTLPNGISGDSILKNFLINFEFINQEFHEQIKFTLCGYDSIRDGQIFNVQGPGYINRLIRENHPDQYVDNYFKVFLNNERYGRGDAPVGLKFPAGRLSYGFTMHEFGHFFGLMHTHETEYIGPSSARCINVLPDSSPNPECTPPSGPLTCDVDDWGYCTGDLIPDTNVDPLLLGSGQFGQNCGASHVVTIAGQDYTYTPPVTNAMSRHRAMISFTPLQRQRMIDVLEIPELGRYPLGGDLSHLIDEDVPEICSPPNFILNEFTAVGKIQKIDVPNNQQIVNMPRTGNGAFTHSSFPPSSLSSLLRTTRDKYYIISPNVVYKASREGYFSMDFTYRSIICNDPPEQAQSYDLDITDLIRLREHILGINDLPKPYGLIAADLDNNAELDVSDMVHMIRSILGISDYIVPAYRFMPRLPLITNEQFAEDFQLDPFNASFEYAGFTFGYKESEGQHSYLGGSYTGTPNTISMPFQAPFPDPYNLDIISFYAVKSGDLTSPDMRCNGASNSLINVVEDNTAQTNSVSDITQVDIFLESDLDLKGYELDFASLSEEITLNKFDEKNLSTTLATPHSKMKGYSSSQLKTAMINLDVSKKAEKGTLIQSLYIPTKYLNNVSAMLSSVVGKVIIEDEFGNSVCAESIDVRIESSNPDINRKSVISKKVLNAYPVPVIDHVNFEFEKGFEGTIRLIDMTGYSSIHVINSSQSLNRIDLSRFRPGVIRYVLLGKNTSEYGLIVKTP